MRAARAWSSGANGGVGVVSIARSPESNGASTCLFCRSPQTRQVRRLSASGRGSTEDGIQPRDLFTESRERVRATPPRGDFTDPRIGASRVDARTRESGRERKDAPKMNSWASGSMFPRRPPMNKRVDRSRSTRLGNSPIETDPNFRWRSERPGGGEGRFLRIWRAGCRSKRGGKIVRGSGIPVRCRHARRFLFDVHDIVS
jgi:hypothetical protein